MHRALCGVVISKGLVIGTALGSVGWAGTLYSVGPSVTYLQNLCRINHRGDAVAKQKTYDSNCYDRVLLLWSQAIVLATQNGLLLHSNYVVQWYSSSCTSLVSPSHNRFIILHLKEFCWPGPEFLKLWLLPELVTSMASVQTE